MAELRKTRRRSFAENSAKPHIQRMPTVHARNCRPAGARITGPVPRTVALGRQTHYTMSQAHLELAVRDARAARPIQRTTGERGCTEQAGGEYGLILRGRRRLRMSSTPGQSPTALGRVWRNNEEDNGPALIDHAHLDRSRERKP